MLSGLILTAFLMGVGGVPHCAAMCGAACAAALPRGVPLSSLLGRCLGYAMLGCVAAASAGLVSQWGRQLSFVQPLWVLLQAMALVLGLLLLFSGQMPRQLDALGQDTYRAVRQRWGSSVLLQRWAWARPMLPLLAGMAWAVLPCGLLYAAVMVAALAPTVWGGGLVMLAFALPSAVGVWAAPAVLRQLLRRRTDASAGGVAASPVPVSATLVPVLWLRKAVDPSGSASGCVNEPVSSGADASAVLLDPRWAVRLSGLMLTLMTAWALYHQMVAQWQAWCA